MLAIIAAVAKNNVIGSRNDLPWYLPNDLKRFKKLTTGNTVIMGRKTFESIKQRLGKPLPDRKNIIITHQPDYGVPNCIVVNSFEKALEHCENKCFAIGGEQIFKEALPHTDILYLTEVAAEIPGDVYFPIIQKENWKEIDREDHLPDEKHEYPYSFVTYERRK